MEGRFMENESKDVQPLVGRKKVKKKKGVRSEFFRIPDLTPADVQEAILDWLRKHSERWERGNG
jgi:hypothetical protein